MLAIVTGKILFIVKTTMLIVVNQIYYYGGAISVSMLALILLE